MIRTENLTRIFRTEEVETIALNGVNIEVEDGEFIAIMGPSGCGKSTLLNILGLLDSPTEGKYWLNNEEVGHLKERERTAYRKGRIGFVFQSFHLLPRLSVLSNVAQPLVYRGLPPKERERLASDIDTTLVDVFAFDGARCDRIVAAVMARIRHASDGGRGVSGPEA